MRCLILVLSSLLMLVCFAEEPLYTAEDQTTGGAAGLPSQIEGLIGWYRAGEGLEFDDSGRVAAWRDGSSGENHLTQGNEGRRPEVVADAAGGLPAMRFAGDDAAGQYLSMKGLSIKPEKGLTLIAVARLNEPGYLSHLLGYGPSYFSPNSLYLSHSRKSGRLATEGLVSSGVNLQGQGFKVVSVSFGADSGQVTLRENNLVMAQGARTEPLAGTMELCLGARAQDYRYGYIGDVAEVLVYNGVLDEVARQTVQRYLEGRFRLSTSHISRMAPLLPFAYYPSANELEVAADIGEYRVAGEVVEELGIEVMAMNGGTVVARGRIALDLNGRGQDSIELPELPDGKYAVEYVIGSKRVRSPKQFERITFGWEGNTLGEDRTVYPPFEPVRVAGREVTVVDRRYTVNGFGLFDSVISLGRELLDGPIVVAGEGADGKRMIWEEGSVAGRAEHADEAVFETSMVSGALGITTRTTIQEDGCARVKMRLLPGAEGLEIKRLWIEIPYRLEAVPYLHWIGDNSMRHNYAGRLPPAHAQWDIESQFWCPVVWSAGEGDPTSGLIWESSQVKYWRNQHVADVWPFVQYVWLGDEARGLAWFGENAKGYVVDYRQPVQQLWREGERVVLRVALVQSPTVIDAAREIEFGLMASPGKPMEEGWRTRHVASGIGPVNCWGGYLCASKYPDKRDFTIVDKIQEARRTGTVDQAWFEERDKEREYPERKVNGSWPWLTSVLHFAGRAAQSREAAGTYFEEHATDALYPEFQVYQDEWGPVEFNRFQEKPSSWGVSQGSYHDFALYYANEWMKRGVSLYFDNTNPKRSYNARWTRAYTSEDGVLRFAHPLFGQREYYRRIWKLAQWWNRNGAPWPIDFTLHMTNTQTLPFNTWATATLDLEQRARKDAEGNQLPWPPEYTRTVTLSRTVGAIPLALDNLLGGSRHHFNKQPPREILSNWGMSRVHEVRGDMLWGENPGRLALKYQQVLKRFGYGEEGVTVHTYWAADAAAKVEPRTVKWLLLERAASPRYLLILQNYGAEPVRSEVALPESCVLMDVETRERLEAGAGVELAGAYGTRMFLADRDATTLPSPPPRETTLWLDGEPGVAMAFRLSGEAIEIVEDEEGNAVVRLGAGKRPSVLQPEADLVPEMRNGRLSLRFRLSAVPEGSDRNGLLHITYRDHTVEAEEKKAERFGYAFRLDVDNRDGVPTWAVSPVSIMAPGARREFAEVEVSRTHALDHGRSAKHPELGGVDAEWHTLTLVLDGASQTILIDETVVFSGVDESSRHGSFTLSSWWRLLAGTSLSHIDIDDVAWRPTPAAPTPTP